jgi:hypothetical protein
MKKKNGILFLLSLMLTSNLFAQGQDKKNIIGFGAGISPKYDYAVWIGEPVNVWVTKNTSPVFQLFYARQMNQALRLGGYFEYESATMKFFSTGDSKTSRLNIGINWLSQFPNRPFHMQLGGYIGYGSVSASDWSQSLYGSDVGIMLGPAYEKNNFGIALHVQYGKGYYGNYKSTGTPNEVGLSIPRFILKVYHKF